MTGSETFTTLAEVTTWISAALVIFMSVFALIVLRVVLMKRSDVEHAAMIPLMDDERPTVSAEEEGVLP